MTKPDYTALCARLDERAAIARSEGTATALGDALHFEQSAAAIRELEAQREKDGEEILDLRFNLEAAEAKLAEAVKMLGERDREYNRLTNDMIERHAATVATLTAQVEAMRGALTPSADTKADYIGEFSFDYCTGFDADGNEVVSRISVPWTTIKEIMAAIRARATLASVSGWLKTTPPTRGVVR